MMEPVTASAMFTMPAEAVISLKGAALDEALAELTDLACRLRPGLDAPATLSSLRAREGVAPTAIGYGIALPHARTAGLERLFLALGHSAKGLKCASPDHHPVHLAALVLGGPNDDDAYRRTLGRLGRLFRNRDNLEVLAHIHEPGQLHQVFLRLLDEADNTPITLDLPRPSA